MAKTVPSVGGYESVLEDLARVIEDARGTVARAVNTAMTAAYWLIGRRIVEHEQAGQERAAYGEELLGLLSGDLTARFGKGYSRRNLQHMRLFYLFYPPERIWQTVSANSPMTKCQAVSGEFNTTTLATCFPLPWSAYVRLVAVSHDEARSFYESEALRSGWSVRQLKRQIDSQFYERTALSKDKAAMLKNGVIVRPDDVVTPLETLKDPYVLGFLNLKDEYSESDLEEALIYHLEAFLLELGGDFCFIGRQKRLRVGDVWYRVDLVFFHRRLRCLVLVDLKLGSFTPAHSGQMHLYLNYAKEHWTRAAENPPVGLILCARKDAAVAHYALDGLPNQVLAAEYRTVLPDEKELAAEIERTRAVFEERQRER